MSLIDQAAGYRLHCLAKVNEDRDALVASLARYEAATARLLGLLTTEVDKDHHLTEEQDRC